MARLSRDWRGAHTWFGTVLVVAAATAAAAAAASGGTAELGVACWVSGAMTGGDSSGGWMDFG